MLHQLKYKPRSISRCFIRSYPSLAAEKYLVHNKNNKWQHNDSQEESGLVIHVLSHLKGSLWGLQEFSSDSLHTSLRTLGKTKPSPKRVAANECISSKHANSKYSYSEYVISADRETGNQQNKQRWLWSAPTQTSGLVSVMLFIFLSCREERPLIVMESCSQTGRSHQTVTSFALFCVLLPKTPQTWTLPQLCSLEQHAADQKTD